MKKKNRYVLKKEFFSSHTATTKLIKKNSIILDLGCGDGSFSEYLKKNTKCLITGFDINRIKKKKKSVFKKFITHNLNLGLPKINLTKFNYILLLDIIEHLDDPDKFLNQLSVKLKNNHNTKIIISTPNIAFFLIRLGLLFRSFNYSERGILDKTHKRFFTYNTLRKSLKKINFKIIKEIGVPAPFALVIGNNFLSKLLSFINIILIYCSKTLFSYQMLFMVELRK